MTIMMKMIKKQNDNDNNNNTTNKSMNNISNSNNDHTIHHLRQIDCENLLDRMRKTRQLKNAPMVNIFYYILP